jgi:hypothetical protein
MNIGILTQPLGNNYGGILQSYALQVSLKNNGHNVCIINTHLKEKNIFIKILSVILRTFKKYLFHNDIILRIWMTSKEKHIITEQTSQFIKQNMELTKSVSSLYKSRNIILNTYDALIVGSDQVWRPLYANSIFNYYFDFLGNNDTIKRISYAASFGVDKWEYTDKQTKKCSAMVQKFNAISVREESALRLCKKYFDVSADHVLDPTLLLSKEHYEDIVVADRVPVSPGSLMTYVLDKSATSSEIIRKVADLLDLVPFSPMPEKSFKDVGVNEIEKCVYPRVTEWIRGFMDASFIVTDSFHGTVFSIIFNKPFISIGNSGRGMTRFTSLLRIFGLEKRLILSPSELSVELITDPMDYSSVNGLLALEREKSLKFLHNALGHSNQ